MGIIEIIEFMFDFRCCKSRHTWGSAWNFFFFLFFSFFFFFLENNKKESFSAKGWGENFS